MGKKYHEQICWQQLSGKNPLQVLLGIGCVLRAGVLVVCQFCFGGRWCLGGTLGFVHVLGVSVVSWQCSGGVLVVLKEWYFLN